MKKIFYAILGASLLLLAGCEEKGEVFYQNPYRIIVDYQPSTFTISGISGTVTADGDYDWITSNGGGSFTVRRNTSGLIRRAEFTVSGSKDKAIVNQRAHSLDATVTPALASQGLGSAEVNVTLATNNPDDYAAWGLVYGTVNDISQGKVVAQSGIPAIGINVGEITGLDSDTDYIIWAYVESTEGDRIYSNPIGLVPPVYVKAGEDLQAAIDGAKEFSEIRVQGGAVFNGTIVFDDKNKNKSISGGWNADFTEQSWDNLTVIDGGGVNRGFYCGQDPISDEPLQGSVEISYFEIRNCLCISGHGSAVRVSGGPVTVHHCYMHDNETDRGTIATREDDRSSDITIYDNIIVNNVANGHAPAISIEDGASRANPTKAVIAGNLIANNRSIKFDGYAGSVYFYQSVDIQFINNTVVNNFNYWEYGGHYAGFYIRNNTCAAIANNLILHTWNALSGEGNEAFLDDEPIAWGGSRVTFYNNLVEGGSLSTSGPADNNTFLSVGTSLSSLLNNADGSILPAASLQDKTVPFAYHILSDFVGTNYMPLGAAVGGGYTGTLEYASYDTEKLGAIRNCDIKGLLEGFGTDINGNPFVKDGKVNIGCFASK